jgi:hypothetical protein
MLQRTCSTAAFTVTCLVRLPLSDVRPLLGDLEHLADLIVRQLPRVALPALNAAHLRQQKKCEGASEVPAVERHARMLKPRMWTAASILIAASLQHILNRTCPEIAKPHVLDRPDCSYYVSALLHQFSFSPKHPSIRVPGKCRD